MTKQLSKETKQKLKDIETRGKNIIPLICSKCKRTYEIRTDIDNVKLYTEELAKSYICLLCR